MEGISKDKLLKLRNKPHQDKETVGTLDWLINVHCQELNEPWIPMDENVPNDRPILLFFRGNVNFQAISEYNHQTEQFAYQAFTESTPTHYKELPDDPVEIHKPEPPR